MSKEVTVSLPLSDYQDLVRRVNGKEAPFLIVGRRYEVELNGNRLPATCQSVSDGKYQLVCANGIETVRINISLEKQ